MHNLSGEVVMYFSLVLCRQQIESMLRWAETEEDIMHSALAMLFLVTYVFLLRLPSEALPIEVGRVPGKQQQAVLEMDDGKLILTFMRRKNRPAGSKLERTCWCKESCRTCPVHVLGPAVRGIQPGTALSADSRLLEPTVRSRTCLVRLAFPRRRSTGHTTFGADMREIFNSQVLLHLSSSARCVGTALCMWQEPHSGRSWLLASGALQLSSSTRISIV